MKPSLTQLIDSSSVSPPTTVTRLMWERGVTKRMVANRTGLATSTISRALDPHQFIHVVHGTLAIIRSETEFLLRALGWEGDATELWNEYEQALRLPNAQREAA